jgi:DNA repair exonuclease SbcCD ATPase subunit
LLLEDSSHFLSTLLQQVDEARKSADDFGTLPCHLQLVRRSFRFLNNRLTSFFLHAAKRYEQLNSDPRRNEIPIEIRREEDKIDKLKRQIEDDRMHLDTLRHSAEAQNTISVLKSQCTRDLEALHESLREQSYELQKHNLQPTGQLPGANGEDDNGDQLVAYVETLVDEVQNKYDAADTEVTRVQEALDRAQKTVSEKTALLKSRQQSSASLRAKLDSLSGNNGPIAKVGNVIEELRKHGTDPAVLNVLGDDKGPRVILNHLDEQLELIEESDPSSVGTPAVVRKVLNKLKKLVSSAFLISSFSA